MGTGETLALGAVAGFTIFLGLPLGRMQNVSAQTKAFLSSTATGILVFLLWDILSGAVVLIIGFGLHNATEGLGICAPLTGETERPSWGFLFLLGLVGGAPTFFGTLLGHAWVNEPVSILFLALAAGSILYVVIELLNV